MIDGFTGPAWDGSSSDNWGTGANWDTGSAPNSTGVDVLFYVTGAANLSIDVPGGPGTNRDVSRLIFTSQATSSVTLNGARIDIFANPGDDVGIFVHEDSGTHTINSTVRLEDDQVWEINNDSTTFTVAGNVIEDGTDRELTKTGAGILVLSGTNTFDGGFNINEGVVRVSSDANLGDDGDVVFNGGTINATSSFTANGDHDFVVNAGGGTLDINNGVTVTIDETDKFTGSGPLTITGAGTFLIDDVANNLTGTITVDGATVDIVNNADASAFHLGTGGLVVQNGGTILGNFQSNNGLQNGSITMYDGTLTRSTTAGSETQYGTGATDIFNVYGDANLENRTGTGALIVDSIVNVHDGAVLTLDAQVAGGQVVLGLGANLNIMAGGRVRTTGPGTSYIGRGSARNIIGTGGVAGGSEAVLELGGNPAFNSGTFVTVNGVGTQGLRIEGTPTNINTLMTTTRIQGVAGSGGTLTFAPSANMTINTAPTTSNNPVRLGTGSTGSGNVTTSIGSTANSLANWNGLVVNDSFGTGSSTTSLLANQSFTAGTQTTEFDMLGGTLLLNGNTATFEGAARLEGGQITGGGGITIGGNLVSNGTTLNSSPNITMNVASGTNTVSGSASLLGIGTFTKNGAGTVRLDTQIGAATAQVNAGTLQLGGNNVIADTTNLTLANNTTFDSNGFNETLGDLTVTNNATLDFGAGASVVSFEDLNWGGGTLSINDWSGSLAGGGTDQFLIQIPSTDPLLASGFLDNVNFAGFGPGATYIDFGTFVEIVPVPEPSTYALLGLAALGGWYCHRRKRKSGESASRANS